MFALGTCFPICTLCGNSRSEEGDVIGKVSECVCERERVCVCVSVCVC